MTETLRAEGSEDHLAKALVDWLTEAALEKRRAREQEDKTASRSWWSRFWPWLAAYGTILLAIASAIAGGFQYFHQESIRLEQKAAETREHQRQEQIRLDQRAEERRQQEDERVAQFAMDLAEPEKRSSAAYALAVLGREHAVPLLGQQLRDASGQKDAADFRSALASALIMVGGSGLEEAIRLNRALTSYYYSGDPEAEADVAMVKATQTVILHFLIQPGSTPSTEGVFDRTRFHMAYLSYADLSGIKMRNAIIYRSSLCSANLRGADLSSTRLINGTARSANFDEVKGAGMDFDRVVLTRATFRGAKLQSAKFFSEMVESDLSKADLTDAVLTNADLLQARLSGSILRNAQLNGANLYRADLAGADLEGADLNVSAEPFKPGGTLAGRENMGAFVLDADFSGATGLSADTLHYLCQFGAKGVPGGCAGVSKEDVKAPTVPPLDVLCL
jgi:uncharacterized protein YjbI with pentapeptide repeats